MERARSRDRRPDLLSVTEARRCSASGFLFVLAALLGVVPAQAGAARVANLAHLNSVDRVAVEVNLEDDAALSRLSAAEWKGKLEAVADSILREHRLVVADGESRRLRILIRMRAPLQRPRLRAALVVIDLREPGLLHHGDQEVADEAAVATSWGMTAMILAGPAMLDTCIVTAVKETVTDFARLVTRGVEPRSRSGSCTILRIDRR